MLQGNGSTLLVASLHRRGECFIAPLRGSRFQRADIIACSKSRGRLAISMNQILSELRTWRRRSDIGSRSLVGHASQNVEVLSRTSFRAFGHEAKDVKVL